MSELNESADGDGLRRAWRALVPAPRAGGREPRWQRGPGLGVPAPTHPLLAPALWAELVRSADTLHWVVVDVARGPGVRPDPVFSAAVGALRDAGVPLLGYLDCADADRHEGSLTTQAARYLSWYRLEGLFLDRFDQDRFDQDRFDQDRSGRDRYGAGRYGAVERPEARCAALRGIGAGRLVVRPSGTPRRELAELVDQLVTFDGPWSAYRSAEPPPWVDEFPADRFCHLVHGVPLHHLDGALRLARWQGAGTVCVTDRVGPDPWEELPAYWRSELVSLARASGAPGSLVDRLIRTRPGVSPPGRRGSE